MLRERDKVTRDVYTRRKKSCHDATRSCLYNRFANKIFDRSRLDNRFFRAKFQGKKYSYSNDIHSNFHSSSPISTGNRIPFDPFHSSEEGGIKKMDGCKNSRSRYTEEGVPWANSFSRLTTF